MTKSQAETWREVTERLAKHDWLVWRSKIVLNTSSFRVFNEEIEVIDGRFK